MPALIFDTSTERGFVAITEEENLLFHSELPFGLQNSQHLLPEIHRGLQQTKLAIGGLEFVGVGVGPGSYTGIRVGATVAKTLTFACRLPLIGICSLDGFIPDKPSSFAAVIDAKIGGVYLQIGEMMDGQVHYVTGPEVHRLQRAVELLCDADVQVLVTPNASQLRSKLVREGKGTGTGMGTGKGIGTGKGGEWEWQESYPSPQQMAKIANEKFAKQEFSLDGHLNLLYMRKTQAEIEKENIDC